MTAAERINIAVTYTNGSPNEITAAILAALEPEMAVVKAAVAMEVFVKSNPLGTMPLEEVRAVRRAVRALPPEWREGKS